MSLKGFIWIAQDKPVLVRRSEPEYGQRVHLECYLCGSPAFLSETDADGEGIGHFMETDPLPCPVCGFLIWVSADDGEASVSSQENRVCNIGQPKCDGSEECAYGDGVPDGEFAGILCDWECPRAAEAADRLTLERLLARQEPERRA